MYQCFTKHNVLEPSTKLSDLFLQLTLEKVQSRSRKICSSDKNCTCKLISMCLLRQMASAISNKIYIKNWFCMCEKKHMQTVLLVCGLVHKH